MPALRRASLVAVVVAAGLLMGLVGLAGAQDTELDHVRAERERLEADAATATEELEQLGEAIADAQTKRERLESDVATMQTAATAAQDVLAEQVVRAYTHGDFGPVAQLLSALEPQEAIERARLLAGLSLRERELVERASVARAALATRRIDLDRVLTQLRADESRAAALRAKLDAAFARAQATETELATRQARQRQVSRAGQRGTYACPLGSPLLFRDTYGAPRSGGRRHKGVDMFAPYGANVYAVTRGIILRHSSSRLGGVGLYLRGDDGNVYYYAHLSSIASGYRPGRRVDAGELIAYNGDSGNARGGAPHIHFEVRPSGRANVNPYPYTAAACL